MAILGNNGQPFQPSRKASEMRTVEITIEQTTALEHLATLEITEPPGVLLGPKAASQRVRFFLSRFLNSQHAAIRAAVALATISCEMKGKNDGNPTLAIAPTEPGSPIAESRKESPADESRDRD